MDAWVGGIAHGPLVVCFGSPRPPLQNEHILLNTCLSPPSCARLHLVQDLVQLGIIRLQQPSLFRSTCTQRQTNLHFTFGCRQQYIDTTLCAPQCRLRWTVFIDRQVPGTIDGVKNVTCSRQGKPTWRTSSHELHHR